MGEGANIDNLNIEIAASTTEATSSLESILSAFKDLKDAISSVVKILGKYEDAAKKNAEASNETSRSIKDLNENVKKVNSNFSKLFASIGRIAFYRTIRTALKGITSAVKEGLTNLKAYSSTFGTEFSPAVDNLRQHVLLLKNAFATALRPVIEAFIPILIKLSDWLSIAADFLAQVFSVLTGRVDDKGRYTKAVLGDLQESNEEAKKLKRTLLGFDEINRLEGDNGNGKADAASTNFIQADIGESAKGVADFLKGVDWGTVFDVVMTIGTILALAKASGTVSSIGKIVKSIGSLAAAHPVLSAIIAVLIALGIWGDKISEVMEKAKTAVSGVFAKVEQEGSTASAIIKLLQDSLLLILDIIGTVSSMVYKLFHGDFVGAFQDFIHLLATLLKGVVTIVIDVTNIVLGLVEDVVNGVIAGVRWLWNNALQPVFNAVAKWFKQAGVDLHNAWISIRVGINDAIIWILEKINGLLGGLESVINGVIDLINWAFGEDIKPVKLQIDTSSLKETRERLENEKWPDIDQNIDLVAKWETTPDPIKLKIDATALYSGIDSAEKYINGKLESLRKEAEKTRTVVSSVGGGADSGMRKPVGYADDRIAIVQLYASGGYPSAGSLFIAGEQPGQGPEYVGSVNGQTGVWNSDQLVQGMYAAMSAALAANPSGGDIYLDGEVIYKNTVRRNNNAVRATGRSALLT